MLPTGSAFGHVQRTSRTPRFFRLILAKLVEENKLEPTEDQIKAVVANFAESYEDPQEVIDWYYAEPSRLQGPTSFGSRKQRC